MNSSQRLFYQPQLKLALLYTGVIGSILLGLGYVAHTILDRAFERVIDQELHLLTIALNAKLETILKEPGKIPKDASKKIIGLCFLNTPCQLDRKASELVDLFQDDYHFQLLNPHGYPVAALGESPDRSLANPTLIPSTTVNNAQGKPYHLHLMPLKTQQGQLWGYLQVGRSVQQRNQYMERLHLLIAFGTPLAMIWIGGASWWLAGMAIQPIYQAYATMQRFTADAAHELRTPIAAAKAMVEVALTNDTLTLETSQQVLQALHRQTDRLGKLAQDLLLLSRLDTSPAASPREAICLNDLVQDLEEELAPLALAAQVELASQIQTQSKLYIHGNCEQIYRLVSNLITNAIAYTPAQGSVTLRLSHKHRQALLSVEDTGVGIAATDLPHLFERFYRSNSDRSRQTGGSGLGLAIAQAIAQAHGGSIHVRSQVGEGSIFGVHLPLKGSQDNRGGN